MSIREKFIGSLFPALAAVLLAGSMSPALAQGNKPVRIIVPYGTGSGADIVSRMIAAQLAERLKEPVIVENRPGNSAIIGVNVLKNSPPDGYTIGVLVSGNAAQPWLTKDLPFDIRKDFIPLTLLYSGPLVMTVPVTLPVKTLAEFVAYAKANSGKVFYGTLGAGTTTHLAAEFLKQAANIQMTNVPFKGSAEIHTAVASGEVQVSFDNYISPKPLVDAGKLRAIAITSKNRTATLPNLPTVAESYPGVEVGFWTGFAAPANTPKEMTDRIGAALRAVLAMPEIRRRIAETGSEPGGGSAAEFSALIDSDYEKFGKVIRAAGLKPE